MEKTYRYLPYFFTLALLGVIAAFYKSYFGHFPDFEGVISPIGNVPIAITKVTHFHALMMVLWMLLLIVQPLLIIKKKLKWHRVLGRVSYGVVALLVISLVLIIRQEQMRGMNLPVFAANLLDPFMFVVYYGLAIYYRRKQAWHSRFMILTITSFIGPALVRLQLGGIDVIFGWFAFLLILEWRTSKVYRPYLIGFGYYLLNLAVVAYLFLFNQPLLIRLWEVFFGRPA